MSVESDIWNALKCASFRREFMAFLQVTAIHSKETGGFTILGDNVWGSQERMLDAIFDGLQHGIHDFKFLKSRQLGCSTFARAFAVFWLGVHDGLQGALILDSDSNKESARREIETMIANLPAHVKFPRVKAQNRYGLTLENGSKLNFLSAGTKKGRTSGGLGRSIGLNFVIASEMCNWENIEGVEALKPALSKTFPNRLYIWESTARGPNLWQTMWEEAENDDLTQRCTFLGWWSRHDQRLITGTPLFNKYSSEPITDKERARMTSVKAKYDVDIDLEQLSWFRMVIDPTQILEQDESEDPIKTQEQPWTDEEAFQITGSAFFSATQLSRLMGKTSAAFQSYKFHHGTEFMHTTIEKARSLRETQLKVWEEPASDSVYIIAADPAFGHDPLNNNSAIQVIRCFADKVEQVAEFGDAETPTSQFAWVIAALCGYYGVGPNGTYKNQVEVIIEINGPGESVFKAFKEVKANVESPHLRKEVTERGIKNIFQNVRNYIYSRTDSYTRGEALMWKCLAIDEPIPTPSGWANMGDLRVGDWVFDENGEACDVIRATPHMNEHECYQIRFDDGSSIVADADHLWRTSDGIINKTTELTPGKHTIDVTAPFSLPEEDYLVHPYTLGVWLGDGYSEGGRYCGHKNDIPHISKRLISVGEQVSEIAEDKRNAVRRQTIVGLAARLRKLELYKNKHIPQEYLRGSYEQRLELLRGLMDTDGSITKGQMCTFTTSSGKLAEGFSELLRTLGIKSKCRPRDRTLFYKGKQRQCARSFQFSFTIYEDMEIFTLPRKLEKQARLLSYNGGPVGKPIKARSKRHKIISVEQIASVPVRCIEVNSESHLYLAGTGMIPTHNTTSQLKESSLERLRDFSYSDTLLIRSLALIMEMQKVIRDGETIGAPGMQRDDKTIAMAMATRAWEDSVRRRLMSENKTKQRDEEKRIVTPADKFAIFNRNQLEGMFKKNQMNRIAQARKERHDRWRFR